MKFTRKRFSQLGIVILSSFMSLSCGDKSKSLTEKLNDVVKDASASDADEIKKYNQYIDFYNQFLSNGINSKIDDYLKQAGEGDAVKKGEKSLYASAYFGWDRIESNMKAKPSMKELDEAAGELIPVSKELDELLVSAKDYYTAKDYLDDNYVKGQELHTKILAAIKKFDAAYEKFNLALMKKEEETQSKEMEEAKKEGYEITYNKILVLKSIDKIVGEINSQKINAYNITTTDLTKIKPLYEEFNKAQKALRDASQNEEMLKKENFESFNKSSLTTYIDKTTEFKTGVLDLIERVETKTPVDKFKLQHNMMINREKGTSENLFRIREEIVTAYNGIR